MSDVTAFRLLFTAMMVLIIIIMWRNSMNTAKLLQQGQKDKEAREEALLNLKKTADELAIQTKLAIVDAEEQRESLSRKMDTNTEKTIKAVEAKDKGD